MVASSSNHSRSPHCLIFTVSSTPVDSVPFPSWWSCFHCWSCENNHWSWFFSCSFSWWCYLNIFFWLPSQGWDLPSAFPSTGYYWHLSAVKHLVSTTHDAAVQQNISNYTNQPTKYFLSLRKSSCLPVSYSFEVLQGDSALSCPISATASPYFPFSLSLVPVSHPFSPELLANSPFHSRAPILAAFWDFFLKFTRLLSLHFFLKRGIDRSNDMEIQSVKLTINFLPTYCLVTSKLSYRHLSWPSPSTWCNFLGKLH